MGDSRESRKKYDASRARTLVDNVLYPYDIPEGGP